MQLVHKTFGAGDPLVILHGLFGTLDNWQTLAKRFGESRMAVAVDLPNHGRSPHTEVTGYKEMAGELASFLGDQWMHEADVLGHSMGGKVAMQYALTYPGRVRKLIVVDMAPHAYPSGHEEILAAMESLPLDAGFSRAELDELLSAEIKVPATRMFLLKNLAREGASYRWKLNLPLLRREYEKVLAPVTGKPWIGPALFIRGGDSGYVRDQDWAGVQTLFPAAQLETVEGAGHWLHAEQPDRVYELVERFLAE